jgi:ABC-2 type transport system ATP-binding protein
MDTQFPGPVSGPAKVTADTVNGSPIEVRAVSKWYGNVIGLNRVSLAIPPGVTGLLGPNGAGKSTLLQLATGQLRPSQGSVRVLGHPVWGNRALNRFIGLCPEQDAFYEWMTGLDFVETCARLSGMAGRARSAAERAVEVVGMTANMNRPIQGYSKGMRQRIKLAQAIVHDPIVLFLDEPLTGTDPVARRDLIEVIVSFGKEGRTVLVSSHVLHEVQAMTPRIVLLHRGRLVAEGDVRQLRDLIDKYPHRIVLVCDNYRAVAAKMVSFPDVIGVKIQDVDQSLIVETHSPDAFYARVPQLALEEGWKIQEVYSDDDSLEAVFKYLVNK